MVSGSVLFVEPVAEPARLPALVQFAVMAEEPSPEVAADSARAAGIVAVTYAAANTVGVETVVAAPGGVNILDFGVSKKVSAAVKGRDQTAFSVERVVEATRRAAGTYAAVAVDDDAIVDTVADTSCSAPPGIAAAAAKHSLEVYIAWQLVASGVPHTLVPLYRIPEKSFACRRTALSAAAEGTSVVAAADPAVEASNRTAAGADVEGSYTAGNRRAYKMKADSCRALAAVAVSLVGSGPGPGHEKACSSWPLLGHCIPLSRY